MRAPSIKSFLTSELREPMTSEADMFNLFFSNDLLNARSLIVSHSAKALSEDGGVI
jgi:hypothetical protein